MPIVENATEDPSLFYVRLLFVAAVATVCLAKSHASRTQSGEITYRKPTSQQCIMVSWYRY
jgi:hypothetical protein